MKKILIGISVGALALATAGIAAEMHHMGADSPPTITRVEAKAAAEAAFAKLDVNHDGKLDAGDRAARMGEMFDKIDANKDGTISRDEFVAAHEKMGMGKGPMGMGMGGEGPGGHAWRQGHEHHDDSDDRDDHEGHHGHRMGHGDRMGEGRAKMGMLMAILHEADPNHTGSVSRDAFVGGALKLFDKADTNHDGKVTPQERHAARSAMREQMRKQMHENMGRNGMNMGDMKMGGMDHDHMGDMAPPAAAK